ncbi:MAG TPA: carboxypeptidase-like regulatory domain-containing protein, partial [Thermoplasmata archaeon]|nr:carboxypeptidase-like regulatory domain-containing protein [Thermoplasmata archaeon]
TWLFDFHTDLWRQIATPVAPNGRFGASMAWDPVAREFLLVAGCGLSCAMDAWAFRLNSTSWVQLPQSGTIPPGRAGATFAWDPGAQQALLYGGMSFDSNGTQVVYSDTYKFLPNGGWTRFTPAAPGPPTIYQPGPIFDAAATWVNFPDCDVLFIAGGNPALTSVTGMVYAIMPNNDTPYFQCWWWFSIPVGPAGPPPACSHASELVVTVEDDATHVPIPNAIVSVSGQCLPAIGYTGSDGSVEFTIPTPDNLSLNVSAPAYHGNATWYNYTYINSTANNTNRLIRYIVITLVAFPEVNIQVLGNNGGIFLYPVPFAAVALNNVSVIAVTRTNGWGNASGISDFNRTAVVSATAENYSSSWKAIRIPYTGEINATLVILKAGTLTVLVVDGRNAHPIPGAHGLLTRLDPGLPSPFHFVTGANGRYSTQLPLGNYSATATATGFLPETVGRSAYLPWIENATIQLSMTLDYGTNVSVQLLDAETGHPIGGGSVTFGGSPPHVAPASGVVKGIDLGPPGPMKIVGYAAGYQQNSTTVTLGYNLVLPMVTLRLVPLCPLSCQAQRNAGPPGVSPLLPAGGSGLLLLLAAPAFLVVGGAMYAILGSVRRSATAGPVGRSFARGAGALERGDAP